MKLPLATASMATLYQYYYHPTDRKMRTTALIIPAVGHWLEYEIV